MSSSQNFPSWADNFLSRVEPSWGIPIFKLKLSCQYCSVLCKWETFLYTHIPAIAKGPMVRIFRLFVFSSNKKICRWAVSNAKSWQCIIWKSFPGIWYGTTTATSNIGVPISLPPGIPNKQNTESPSSNTSVITMPGLHLCRSIPQ